MRIWLKTCVMKIKDALNISDLRRLAKRRLPRMVFDYIDGGADDEVTLRENSSRFSEINDPGPIRTPFLAFSTQKKIKI